MLNWIIKFIKSLNSCEYLNQKTQIKEQIEEKEILKKVQTKTENLGQSPCKNRIYITRNMNISKLLFTLEKNYTKTINSTNKDDFKNINNRY